MRLTARVVRIRNACLLSLADGEGLPVPDESVMAAIGNEVGLGEAFGDWSRRRAPRVASEVVLRGKNQRRRGIPGWRLAIAYSVSALVLAAGLCVQLELTGRLLGFRSAQLPFSYKSVLDGTW